MSQIWVFSLNRQVVSAHTKKKAAFQALDNHCSSYNLRKRPAFEINGAQVFDLQGDVIPLQGRITPTQLT